jgi:Family of unknown function (DUF5330)
MWLLVRMAFWLSLVFALLPVASSQQETSASQVGAIDALSAASAAVSDIRQFCVRQPGACAAAHKRSFSSDKRQRPAQSGFISF